MYIHPNFKIYVLRRLYHFHTELSVKFGIIDWEQRKLGEVGSTFTGLSGKTKEDFGHGDAKFVTYVNVFNNVISDPNGVESVEIDNKQNQIKYGDVFFTTSSETPEEVGMSSVWLENIENVYLNSFCFGYRPTVEFDLSYLAFMLRSPEIRKKFMFLAQGISRYNISKNKVMEMKVPVPKIHEQRKVGAFFKELDNLITLHQRKYDALLKLKEAYLQNMFPEKGESLPKVRFANFGVIWEQRKFKDFITKTGEKNKAGEDYPAYSVSNSLGLIPQSEQFEGSRLDGLDKSEYKFVKPDEFAYNPARINVGSIAFNDLGKTVIVSSLYVVIYMNEKLDNEFALQYIKSPEFLYEVKRNTEGSVREYLFYENFSNVKIPYTPNIEEQKKIGAFFKDFDTLITFHQQKLEKLHLLKEAYLQKMFV